MNVSPGKHAVERGGATEKNHKRTDRDRETMTESQNVILQKELKRYVKSVGKGDIIKNFNVCSDIIQNICSFAVDGYVFNCSCPSKEEIY